MACPRLTASILLLAILASCDRPTGSNMLEPVKAAEVPPELGTGPTCFLWAFDDPDHAVRMIATGRQAVVRFRGRPLRLRFEGGSMREGGTFRGQDMSVSVENVPLAQARSEADFDAFPRVTVQVPGRKESFRAIWSCHGRAG